MAQVKRVFGARVAVDAGKQHIGPVIKNGLGAVAMVVVHVQHGHARQASIAQVLGRQGGVVEKAVDVAATAIEPKIGNNINNVNEFIIKPPPKLLQSKGPHQQKSTLHNYEQNRFAPHGEVNLSSLLTERLRALLHQ